jgi:hypothetical protein
MYFWDFVDWIKYAELSLLENLEYFPRNLPNPFPYSAWIPVYFQLSEFILNIVWVTGFDPRHLH